MKPRAVAGGVALTGLALALALAEWRSHATQQVAAPVRTRMNTAWEHVASPNVTLDRAQLWAADQYSGQLTPEQVSERPDSTKAQDTQPHAITLQDGTVLWGLERERAGSSPARER
jgi:hypothetical protein